MPDDLYAALGTQFSLVFGGMGEGQSELQVAAVTDGDKAVLQKLADAAGQGMGAGGLTLKSGRGPTPSLSLSDGYADELATEHGLGDTARFKDAVQDADSAGSPATSTSPAWSPSSRTRWVPTRRRTSPGCPPSVHRLG